MDNIKMSKKNEKIWSEIGKLIGIPGMYPYFLKNYRHSFFVYY